MKRDLADLSTDTSVEELKTNTTKILKKPKTLVKRPILVPGSQIAPGGGTKELVMHSLMYGTNLYNELSEFRA